MINKPILQENEEIRDIEGYEGLYAVTSYGRVWSYKSNKFLKPWNDGFGYYQVRFMKDGKPKALRVHRLVAQTFLANPDNKTTVNHKDENRANNHVDNLEWMSQAENNSYGTRMNKIRKSVYCVELNKTFESQVAAARELGLTSSGGISLCCKGKQSTCSGYHWEFVEEGAAAC